MLAAVRVGRDQAATVGKISAAVGVASNELLGIIGTRVGSLSESVSKTTCVGCCLFQSQVFSLSKTTSQLVTILFVSGLNNL
jgi:hypothetical protein